MRSYSFCLIWSLGLFSIHADAALPETLCQNLLNPLVGLKCAVTAAQNLRQMTGTDSPINAEGDLSFIHQWWAEHGKTDLVGNQEMSSSMLAESVKVLLNRPPYRGQIHTEVETISGKIESESYSSEFVLRREIEKKDLFNRIQADASTLARVILAGDQSAQGQPRILNEFTVLSLHPGKGKIKTIAVIDALAPAKILRFKVESITVKINGASRKTQLFIPERGGNHPNLIVWDVITVEATPD
jgi:hypothetical protein